MDDERILVICDSPAPARIDGGTISADLFALPDQVPRRTETLALLFV